MGNLFKYSSIRNGELKIGVTFDNIEHEESDDEYMPRPIPTNLINAWKDQLFNFQPADVEFNVQGENFYVRSSVLSKRSEYFASILSGKWAESTAVQTEEKAESESLNNYSMEVDEH